MQEKPILQVKNLKKQYGEGCSLCKNGDSNELEKNYCPTCGTVYACRDLSFDLYKGEILGIVGESGSGKSTLMRCLYFDEETTAGDAYIKTYQDGLTNILSVSSQQKRYIRNHMMGMVYQNPIHGLRMNFSSVGNIAEKLIAAGIEKLAKWEKK